MTRSIAFLELVLLLIAIPTNARASRRYVRVPDVDWSAIEPYLRVHVVPEVRNGALAVFVCTGRIDRSAVNGYDEDLGDFTKAFLFDALLGSKPIQRGFSTLKERLLDRVSPVPSGSVEVGDLAELPLREALWNELRMSSLLDDLRARYARVRKRGRIRCRVCEEEPSFRPRGLVPERAR